MPQEVEDILRQVSLDAAIYEQAALNAVEARAQRGLYWAKELVSREVPL